MQRSFDLEFGRDELGETFKHSLQSLGLDYGPRWPDRFGEALEEWACQSMTDRIPTLSLFSGAGGLDIGFNQAGFDIKVAVEIDERFTATLRANQREGDHLESCKILTTDIREYHPSQKDSFEFIIGGPPCQSFSAAGRRAGGVKGTSDENGALFKEYVRILDYVKPTGFLFENVYGITGAQRGTDWQAIKDAFGSIGYRLFSRILDSADYGVPQHRERMFIVGLREGTYEFPRPLFGPDSPGKLPFYAAAEAIDGVAIPSLDDPTAVRGRYGHLLKNIPPGLNYSFYTEKMGHPNPIFSWRSKFSDFLYKADPGEPVRTIKAQGGQYTGPFHWDNRPFIADELKRLQTFPDDYAVTGGRQAVIQQIGNSVPPQLARTLALSIIDQVFAGDTPFSLPTLQSEEQLGFRRRKRERTSQYAQKAADAIGKLKVESNESQPAERYYRANLSEKFGWFESQGGSFSVSVRVGDEGTLWEILLQNEVQDGPTFEIELESVTNRDWGIKPTKVVLHGESLNRMSFTATWKAFEHELMSRGIKGDLVQLCGYYQYDPSLSADLKIQETRELSPSWSIVRLVTSGVAVRKTMPLAKMASLWNVSLEDARQGMHFLRELGYEVRNNNTNPQMEPEMYLIPYLFPSLTPLSVQLKKSLSPRKA